MRDYELTVVLKPDLEDDARMEVIARLEAWLTGEGGESTGLKKELWGQRTLAYPIRKYTEGYYIFYELELDSSKISEIERNILYMDDVLRHLIVRKPE